MYYQSAITNKIIAENFAKCLDYVYGRGEVENLIEDGKLKVIEEPSIEECLKCGSGSVAVLRYRELNPDATWEEASKAVRKISKQMRRERYKRENAGPRLIKEGPDGEE